MLPKQVAAALIFSACVLVLIVGQAGAVPGALDPAFGSGGIVTSAIGSGGSEANAVAVQTNGKIILGGQTTVGSVGEVALARYDANGALDTSFGSGGKVTTAIGSNSRIRGLAVQPDGKIVAAGGTYVGSDPELLIARYNSDGSLDTSFGSGGTVVAPITDSGSAVSTLALQPDGKIVVGGLSGNNVSFIARYNGNGSLDTSFGSGGIVTPAYNGLTSLALQPDGKIVATGAAYGYLEVERFNPAGTPDETFGQNATASSSVPGYASAIAVQQDGEIVVAGDGNNSDSLGLVRFDANGLVDSSFARGDSDPIGSGAPVDVNALGVQRDGRIVLAGDAGAGSTRKVLVVRFNADGTQDTNFGGSGFVTTPVGSTGNVATALALQPDGKSVVAGYTYNANDPSSQEFAVVRYLGDNVTTRVVPQLKGKKLAAAKSALREAGCPLGRIAHAYSKSVRRGRVIGQKPRAGAMCLGPVRVSLTLSKGRQKHR